MLNRFICWLKGHQWSQKEVIRFNFSACYLTTCDRCGKGDKFLAEARRAARRALSN